MVEISTIMENSTASELGIEPGDKIITINDIKINDYIDFLFETGEPFFKMKVKKRSGEIKEYNVERSYDKRLGISFDDIIFDKLKVCNNNCVFCFVKQQPQDMRNSLLKKDDDYRFSFLQGSFITLTNLKEEDWDKIISYHLSPLYISVHSTNPELRNKMMKNPNASNIMEDLQRLADNEIKFHTQVVLCPGLNDDQELERTISDIASLYPAVESLGIVPVGLTQFREDKTDLATVDEKKAKETIDIINRWQSKLKDRYDDNWLYAADELYLLADKSIPSLDHYNDFPQTENGIGLVRILLNEFQQKEDRIPAEVVDKKNIGIITSILGEKALKPIVKKLNNVKGLNISSIPVKNKHFGDSVTVTGLLTGEDILNKIKDNDYPEKIIIPEVALNDEGKFLDDITIKDFCSNLNNKEIFICNSFSDILEVINNVKTSCSNSWKT